MKTYQLKYTILFFILVFYSTTSSAIIIQGSDFSRLWYFGAGTSMDIGYDSTLNEFSLEQVGSFGIDNVDTASIDIFDGSLNLTAEINESGDLISGELSVIGGSVDLGIAAGTTLLHANLIDFRQFTDPADGFENLDYGPGMPMFEFISSVDVLYTGLDMTDFMDVRIHAFGNPLNLFENDFTLNPYTGTSLVGLVVSVSEPGWLGFLLLLLIWHQHSKQKNSAKRQPVKVIYA